MLKTAAYSLKSGLVSRRGDERRGMLKAPYWRKQVPASLHEGRDTSNDRAWRLSERRSGTSTLIEPTRRSGPRAKHRAGSWPRACAPPQASRSRTRGNGGQIAGRYPSVASDFHAICVGEVRQAMSPVPIHFGTPNGRSRGEMAARSASCVACQGVGSHPVPVVLVGVRH